jgi:hypothetical protein
MNEKNYTETNHKILDNHYFLLYFYGKRNNPIKIRDG